MKRCHKTNSRKSSPGLDLNFNFLAKANALVQEYLRVTEGKGETLGMDADELAFYESDMRELQAKAPVYLPLVSQLLEHPSKFHDAKAVMLVAFDWDDYRVAPWPAPLGLTSEVVFEMVSEQIDYAPLDWEFNVQQVFYAFRLKSKGNPLCVYAMQYGGRGLFYVLDHGQWHTLSCLDGVIELASSCAQLGGKWVFDRNGDYYLTHKQMRKEFSNDPLISGALDEFEDRAVMARMDRDAVQHLDAELAV